jgi:hypothetical protein
MTTKRKKTTTPSLERHINTHNSTPKKYKKKFSLFKNVKKQTRQAHPRREIISIHQLSKIAMTFWIGGSCMVGSVILPLLFKTIDQVTASHLVGQILNILAYIGIICLAIALIEVIINHKLALLKTKRFWYIIAMDLMLIIDYFAIFPTIYRIRQGIAQVAHQIIAVQSNVFDFWHSLSSILFIIICALGILYLIEM